MAGPSAVQLSLSQSQQILHMSHYTEYIRHILHTSMEHIVHITQTCAAYMRCISHKYIVLHRPRYTAYMRCILHRCVMLHMMYYQVNVQVQWVMAAILGLHITEKP